MENKVSAEELKTVQQEWMGNTQADSQEQEIVVRECSCSFD